MENEKYSYYDKDFKLSPSSDLKLNGIYISMSNEKFEYNSANYQKIYGKNGHPALKNTVPENDTIIHFNRYFYLQFTDNGKWKQAGGFYTKEELLGDVKPLDKSLNYDVYKINADTLYLESYNSYQKKFIYLKAILKRDSLLVSDLKNTKGTYVTYEFNEMNIE